MKYLVTYSEVFSRSYIVDADSLREAKKIIEDAVNEEKIMLDDDDYDYDITTAEPATNHDIEYVEHWC